MNIIHALVRFHPVRHRYGMMAVHSCHDRIAIDDNHHHDWKSSNAGFQAPVLEGREAEWKIYRIHSEWIDNHMCLTDFMAGSIKAA